MRLAASLSERPCSWVSVRQEPKLTASSTVATSGASLCSRADFPLYAATGTTASAIVYFEVEPGKRLGLHTDSAQDMMLVLQGEAEAEVDGARARLGQGGLALVPAMVPHDVHNVGDEVLKVIGFFAGAALVHHFYEPLIPRVEVAVFTHAWAGKGVLAGAPLAVAASA